MKRCESKNKEVKYIRNDGGGENKGIEDIEEEMGGVTMERTPPYTPQTTVVYKDFFQLLFRWRGQWFGQRVLQRI